MKNTLVKYDLIERIKDGEYNNEELNDYLGWLIIKYITEAIDTIINYPSFLLDDEIITEKHLNKLVFFNDYKRFKFFVDKAFFKTYPNGHGYSSDSYGLMKNICWDNKVKFLNHIINRPELDFSRNDGVIVHQTYKQKNYEILSMLLCHREEIKKDKKLYDKYSHILRSSKLTQLRKRIYTKKES